MRIRLVYHLEQSNELHPQHFDHLSQIHGQRCHCRSHIPIGSVHLLEYRWFDVRYLRFVHGGLVKRDIGYVLVLSELCMDCMLERQMRYQQC
jgi:hypothetical protein